MRGGYFANAAAAVVYLYAVRMRRLHRLSIPRGIKAFHWSGVEAHAAALAEDRAVSLHAANLLDHARNQGSNLEMALEDFRGESELLGALGDLVLSRAYDIDAEVA